MTGTVRHVLANLREEFPGYADQGVELAGFVWFQGWNDMIKPERRAGYETNLVHLIQDVRKDLGVPRLPVVIGELGVSGASADDDIVAFRKVQAAAVRRPEFAGNVALVETAPFWDAEAYALFKKGWQRGIWIDEDAHQKFEVRASNADYLYLGSGKTFALIGHAFSEAMKKMCAKESDVASKK
jgi:alpha-galactosidase